MKPKNCLIFGASGQIGRNLIRSLTKNNIKVTTINKAAIIKFLSLLFKLFKKLFIVKSNLNLTRNQIFI